MVNFSYFWKINDENRAYSLNSVGIIPKSTEWKHWSSSTQNNCCVLRYQSPNYRNSIWYRFGITNSIHIALIIHFDRSSIVLVNVHFCYFSTIEDGWRKHLSTYRSERIFIVVLVFIDGQKGQFNEYKADDFQFKSKMVWSLLINKMKIYQ